MIIITSIVWVAAIVVSVLSVCQANKARAARRQESSSLSHFIDAEDYSLDSGILGFFAAALFVVAVWMTALVCL